MQPFTSFLKKIWNFIRTKWGIATVVIILILGFALFHKKTVPQTLITVTTGSITETVSVTGNTTPTQSVSLGFENSGVIADVYSSVGQTVSAGDVLADLNTSDLSAQLDQAQADVDTQIAKLESLKAGAQPEDIAASQASLAETQQDLANMYASVSDTLNDSYAKGNDAVRVQINPLFSNAENSSSQLTFTSNNSQAVINAKSERIDAGTFLNSWQTNLLSISPSSNPTDIDTAIQSGVSYLTSIRQLLVDVSSALNGSVSLDTNTLSTYKTDVTNALTEVNTAAKNLNTIAQNIASQKLAVTQAQAELGLKQAGSTQEDIDAQQAQVEEAQASVDSAQAKLENSKIVSPISGTVTQFDAKVGQLASPGTALVSVISSNQFEVDALVPETDVGKISVGNPVDMTFDAFPGKDFVGKLFYIDPAQTITQGVVDYKIKVSFDTPDPQMKSGLTADLNIQTKTDTNALILPQYAVLQNDAGTFVETMIGKTATQTPVTLGISDENGNVEIVSGVTEGEEVLNIGLKQ